MAEKIPIRSATILIKENKVLLVGSKYENGEFYLFPGGGLKYGETLEQAAIRETLEETGKKVKIIKPVYINEYINKKNKSERVVNIFFLAEIDKDDKSRLTDDNGKIKEIKWIKLNNLTDVNLKPEFIKNNLNKDFENNFSNSVIYTIDYKNDEE